MIVADFAVVPMGVGASASNYVEAAYQVLREAGVRFVPGPMSTAVEAESFAEIFAIIEEVNEKLSEMGVPRIITTVRIDFRQDKETSILSKMSHFKEHNLPADG